jgi:hypothetical protein
VLEGKIGVMCGTLVAFLILFLFKRDTMEKHHFNVHIRTAVQVLQDLKKFFPGSKRRKISKIIRKQTNRTWNRGKESLNT